MWEGENMWATTKDERLLMPQPTLPETLQANLQGYQQSTQSKGQRQLGFHLEMDNKHVLP